MTADNGEWMDLAFSADNRLAMYAELRAWFEANPGLALGNVRWEHRFTECGNPHPCGREVNTENAPRHLWHVQAWVTARAAAEGQLALELKA